MKKVVKNFQELVQLKIENLGVFMFTPKSADGYIFPADVAINDSPNPKLSKEEKYNVIEQILEDVSMELFQKNLKRLRSHKNSVAIMKYMVDSFKMTKEVHKIVHEILDSLNGKSVPDFAAELKELKKVEKPAPKNSTSTKISVTITSEDLKKAAKKADKVSKKKSTAKTKAGANLGKKYKMEGVREEKFRIGKKVIKRGDKIGFLLKNKECIGEFSNCVFNKNNAPMGYVVIKFGGKIIERRMSKVFLPKSVKA